MTRQREAIGDVHNYKEDCARTVVAPWYWLRRRSRFEIVRYVDCEITKMEIDGTTMYVEMHGRAERFVERVNISHTIGESGEH